VRSDANGVNTNVADEIECGIVLSLRDARILNNIA
jgi:hypothetical protein